MCVADDRQEHQILHPKFKISDNSHANLPLETFPRDALGVYFETFSTRRLNRDHASYNHGSSLGMPRSRESPNTNKVHFPLGENVGCAIRQGTKKTCYQYGLSTRTPVAGPILHGENLSSNLQDRACNLYPAHFVGCNLSRGG